MCLPFQWNAIIGCDFQDINYGVMFSRKFIDSQENNETAAGLMNLHNNEAGRRVRILMLRLQTSARILFSLQALRSRMQRVCKCHGVSGSCSIRVCWRRMPDLRTVGEALGHLYDGASYVKVFIQFHNKKNILNSMLR